MPPWLAPGDDVVVVAPAGPFPRGALLSGLAWLRERYRVLWTPRLFARKGYLAGDDAERLREVAEALAHPTAKAVVCARGGYGLTRIVDRVPWDTFVARPKWIVGFSDVTALHVEATARSIATIHSANATGLGAGADARTRATFLSALEGRLPTVAWSGLTVLASGSTRAPVRGPLVGGNLSLVESMAAAGRLVVPEGAVLALEDVTERPYRIDRMLTALRSGGHLARASALVFGRFTKCDPGPDGVTVEDVLRDRTGDLGVPVLADAPFGHEDRNDAFVVGREVVVDRGDVHAVPR